MKNETQQRPREPEIGEFVRGVGTLIAVQDRTPPPPPVPAKDHVFEEITARTELWLGDEKIKDFSTLNDFYGLETSVKTATKEAKEYATKRGIGPDSELEVRVIRISSQVRKHPKNRENFYDKRFIEFEAPSHGSRYDLPEDVETVAWSSRKGETVPEGVSSTASGVSSDEFNCTPKNKAPAPSASPAVPVQPEALIAREAAVKLYHSLPRSIGIDENAKIILAAIHRAKAVQV